MNTDLIDRIQARPHIEPFLPESTDSFVAGQLSSIGRNRKILIADDSPVVVKAFEIKFKAIGFEVLLARDAMSAITAARTHKPDLIVMDIHFPLDTSHIGLQWNGLNVLQWLKRFEELAAIPVVVVSSDDASKHKEKVVAAGGAAYFQKPLDFRAFMEALVPLLKPTVRE